MRHCFTSFTTKVKTVRFLAHPAHTSEFSL